MRRGRSRAGRDSSGAGGRCTPRSSAARVQGRATQNVSTWRPGRAIACCVVSDLDAVGDRLLPRPERVVGVHVDDLRRLVIERDGVAEPGARLELLGWREVHLDADRALREQVHLVLEPHAVRRGIAAAGAVTGHAVTPDRVRPWLGMTVHCRPVGRHGAREVLGLHRDVAVRLHEPVERLGPGRRRVEDRHRHADLHAVRAGDRQRAALGADRHVAPVARSPEIRCSRSTVPRGASTCSQGSTVSTEKAKGCRPRLKTST